MAYIPQATVSIKNDTTFGTGNGSEGFIHTWIEITMPGQSKTIVISFGLSENYSAWKTAWESQGEFYDHKDRHSDQSIDRKISTVDAQKIIDQFNTDRYPRVNPWYLKTLQLHTELT